MRLDKLLTELVIFARENGGDDLPGVAEAIHAALARVGRIGEKRRRIRLRRPPCIACERGTKAGLLCEICLAEAPRRVAIAFVNARGLDGMRAAHRVVSDWAKSRRFSDEEAA